MINIPVVEDDVKLNQMAVIQSHMAAFQKRFPRSDEENTAP